LIIFLNSIFVSSGHIWASDATYRFYFRNRPKFLDQTKTENENLDLLIKDTRSALGGIGNNEYIIPTELSNKYLLPIIGTKLLGIISSNRVGFVKVAGIRISYDEMGSGWEFYMLLEGLDHKLSDEESRLYNGAIFVTQLDGKPIEHPRCSEISNDINTLSFKETTTIVQGVASEVGRITKLNCIEAFNVISTVEFVKEKIKLVTLKSKQQMYQYSCYVAASIENKIILMPKRYYKQAFVIEDNVYVELDEILAGGTSMHIYRVRPNGFTEVYKGFDLSD